MPASQGANSTPPLPAFFPGAGNSLTNNDIRESLGANGDVTRGTLVRLAKKFIRQYPEFFGVDVADLQQTPGALFLLGLVVVTPFRTGGVVQFRRLLVAV